MSIETSMPSWVVTNMIRGQSQLPLSDTVSAIRVGESLVSDWGMARVHHPDVSFGSLLDAPVTTEQVVMLGRAMNAQHHHHGGDSAPQYHQEHSTSTRQVVESIGESALREVVYDPLRLAMVAMNGFARSVLPTPESDPGKSRAHYQDASAGSFPDLERLFSGGHEREISALQLVWQAASKYLDRPSNHQMFEQYRDSVASLFARPSTSGMGGATGLGFLKRFTQTHLQIRAGLSRAFGSGFRKAVAEATGVRLSRLTIASFAAALTPLKQ